MASGAPLAATTTSSPLPVRQAWLTASSAGRQRVLPHQRPARVQVLGVLDQPVARLVQRALHRVERIALARQDRVLEQAVERLGERAVASGARSTAPPAWRAARSVIWFCGERAGLVDAQDGGRAQRLDRRHAAREHVAARDPPRAQREEDGEHDRELLGQDGHRHRDAGEEALLPDLGPAAAREREGHHHDRAGHEPDDGEDRGPGARSPSAGGVGSGSTCCSALPILPSSERAPVATTSAMPCPAVTRVPEKTEGRSSPPGRSSAPAHRRTAPCGPAPTRRSAATRRSRG